jgi:hypothetical protein
MKNGVFWDVTPCGFCKNRRFGGTKRLHHQGVVVSLVHKFFVTLMKEALGFSETSAFTRATRRKIPEDTILIALNLTVGKKTKIKGRGGALC